jgi:membrane protease YdiL (CAAX protease family)
VDQLLIFLPFLVPILVANLSERHRHRPYVAQNPRTQELLDLGLRYLPQVLLIAMNLGVLGLAALSLLNELVQMLMPEMVDPEAMATNWLGSAAAYLITSAVAFLPLIPALRRWVARWLPIDPDSFVHTTALTFAVYQIGLSLAQTALIGSLENLTDVEMRLTIWDVILSGIPLALVALGGVGLLIRRDGRSTLERLGLRRPTWKQLVAAAAIAAVLIGFDAAVSLGWQEVDPTSYELLERVSENIFGGLVTVGGALALGLSAGISEELLFRGAVQPRLGLVLAAVLFAIGHLQYGLTYATLEILLIGLVLGLVRKRTSTTLCILIHATYNTVGTLLTML